MAGKTESKTTKLSHAGTGTTVVVDSAKAERLVASGLFSAFSASAKKNAREARRTQLKPSA